MPKLLDRLSAQGPDTKPERNTIVWAKARHWVVGLCAACAGCGPVAHVVQTVIIEPVEYSRRGAECVECRRNQKLAEAAWAKVEAGSSGFYSPDYACGFKSGFADYLFAGGSGEPPPLPPRQYWRPKYETVQGQQAIRDWFAGYRVGVASAWSSGYRQLVTVPASTALAGRGIPPAPDVPAVLRADDPSAPQPLPPPRPLPGVPEGQPPARGADNAQPERTSMRHPQTRDLVAWPMDRSMSLAEAAYYGLPEPPAWPRRGDEDFAEPTRQVADVEAFRPEQ
jgi:hypothetical protein